MKQVTGFVTKHGDFHETADAAELAESRQELEDIEGLIPHIENGFIEILEEYHVPIYRYLEAYHKYFSTLPKTNPNYEDNGQTEEDIARLLKQPSDSDESVPNVGSSEQSEKVRDGIPVDGAGVRGSDASGVRSGKDLATPARPKAAQARRRNR